MGGIGANRANPGRYWYANLMMGAHVLEQSPPARASRSSSSSARFAPIPKFTPVPFVEDELWNGYPGGDERALRRRQEGGARRARRPTATSTGSELRYLLPANLYGPGDNFHETNAHVIPDLIRKMLEGRDEIVLWGDGTPTREFLYVDDCVDGLALAAERYDGREPVNLGTGDEISIRDLAELVADVTGFEGGSSGTRRCRTASRAAASTRAAPASSSAGRRRRRCATGLERTVAWYRSRRAAHAGA